MVKMCTRLATIQGTWVNANSLCERGSFSFILRLGEAGKLLPHMVQFTDKHQEEGKALQSELVAFQEELSGAIEEVWTRPPESKDVTNGAGATVPNLLPGTAEMAKPQDPIDKVVKPQIVEPTWRITLWDRK